MPKLSGLFDTFLSSINPGEDAVDFAIDAHKPIRECLERQDEFKQYVEGSFLYGSYARRTAVGDIKDVDIVILTDFDTEDEENAPKKVLRKLKAALARCYDDPENPEYQRRSIRIDEPLPDNPDVEMTLDIIPAVVVTDQNSPLLVPDRDVDEWIPTHPRGHLCHTTHLNTDDYSKGRYVPLVKMMKWWWKHQCEVIQPDVDRPKPKGFWAECLTGENFDPELTAWADHFIAVLQSVSDKYGEVDAVPELQDPGLDGETIKTNMTLEEFEVFMGAVNESLELAKEARDTEDKVKAAELWQEIFGDDKFPPYVERDSGKLATGSKMLALGDYSHAEPLRWPERLTDEHKVHIAAYLYSPSGRTKFRRLRSDGSSLRIPYRLKYVAQTNVQGEYDVWWQVVNTGRDAANDHGLRGFFFRAHLPGGGESNNPHVNWEKCRYTGKHWIECFIVKDGVCVTRSGRFYVNIRISGGR